MPANFLTTDDLREFKIELLIELKETLASFNKILPEQKRFLRSSEVMELLDVSASTLQHLRIKKILPYSKMGSTFYYDWLDIIKIFEQNKKTPKAKLTNPFQKF
ncbi:MAG: helix-turn-helix domain-containing protein [Saprospiraceae bacterium]|nr:helix-turn-helix domain-containing protein [Saprospiraceae bacterium]MBK7524571.1 helix-turn-helix domain-containing protein [Saprospiraceae bacterium]MBK8373133.1 helix-turn-helix domain-containing protein [Saprospiraceae bacterium]MBK8547751.1 helix-turn-helix domain-containing protein [Saprospiraceae bacterium]MBK8854891.1 helix-turn-helix domain-containing protein [Saprospiraceae bacterium]